MFFATVAVQLGRRGESKIARLVTARNETFASVTVLMLNQAPTVTETLLAIFIRARKRSLSCVHVHMGLQSLSSSERPAARFILTRQGTKLVCAMMFSQFSTIMESLAARVVLASEQLLVCMSAPVPIQCHTVMKCLATRPVVACIGTLIRMPTVVSLEG